MPVRAAAVREDVLLETDSVRGPNLCEEIVMPKISNLVRVFNLLASLPSSSVPAADEDRPALMRTLLEQGVEWSAEERALSILNLYLLHPKPEYGLVIFEALFTGYHESMGQMMSALEKRVLDTAADREATLYPVLVTSLMAAANWCDTSSEVPNDNFSQALPGILGRLLGKYATMTGELPEFEKSFMGRYRTELTAYLSKMPHEKVISFRRARMLTAELDRHTVGGINEDVYQFLQEVVQRTSMLFPQKTQIEMLNAQLEKVHIPTYTQR